MSQIPTIKISEIDPRKIDLIFALWGKLNAHHAGISAHFSKELCARSFEERKSQLIGNGKKVLILIASLPGIANPIAYCVASLRPSGEGEIDSVFVEEEYRDLGIGTKFMNRAMAWLEESGATAKSVSVLFENATAFGFYARFGFYPRTAQLIQKQEITIITK